MSERVIVEGVPIELHAQDFVAAGGQGRVFAVGEIAFKVFSDPASAPPPDKLQALKGLQGPHVAAPLKSVHNERGSVIGYTMPFFKGAHSWAQLCTPAFRRRAGLDDGDAMGLVRSLGAALAEVHRHGATVVDLSENNVLVRGRSVCLIDLDSWQLPGHPPTAVTPTILSPHVPDGCFDADTDWFAFAILTCTLLLGIHPFKGKHPSVRGLGDRMQAQLSVFDADVRIPSICKRPDSLPTTLRAWLEQALHRGQSGPPPLGPLPNPVARTAMPPGDTHRYPADLRWVVVQPQHVFVATTTAAFEGPRCWHDDGRTIRALGLTKHGDPFVLQDAPNGGTELRVSGCDARVEVSASCDALVSNAGRVFARMRGRLVELEVQRIGARPILITREVARVLPFATQLFPGVAVQNALGSWCASLLGHPCGTPQVPLPALGSCEVLDARRCGDRLVILSQHLGTVSRHSFRLSPDGSVAEQAVAHHTEPWGTTFVVAGDLYVEVGEEGSVRLIGSQIQPWASVAGHGRNLDLHTNGQRIFVSAGPDLRELPPLRPMTGKLGFDATRCR